jgi:hypothetical protein
VHLQAGADVGLHGGAGQVLLHLPRLPQQRRLGALLPPRPLLVQLLLRLELESERVSGAEVSQRFVVALPCRQRLPACVHGSCGPARCLRIGTGVHTSGGMVDLTGARLDVFVPLALLPLLLLVPAQAAQ